MEYIPVRVSDIIRQVNHDIYLPAIQREFVWGTDRIERLFDSIMADFPIGSFLYWKLEQKNKDEWPVYEFIRDFDAGAPHNPAANMAGITKDITLVLDGQQRITSLFIGLRGSFRYFYFRWRKARLFLNLLKPPVPNEDNPEELTYGFSFRESADPIGDTNQLWYQVGRILDFEEAEDAKSDMRPQLALLPDEQKENANKLIGRLHNRIHTTLVGNYYQEKSQDYDKVLQVFVRANSAGQPLEYSDLLLATATAKWETLDARSEINEFTDALNNIGSGYAFGKDFVLKSSLYLTESLPIQYKVKNFSRTNLRKIEANWENIKESLATTVRLISRFGFHSKNIITQLALLPIAFYLMKRGNRAFDTSSNTEDAEAQIAIRKWFVFSTLKNAFGGSSDTTLTRLRELLNASGPDTPFPAEALYRSLEIEPRFNDAEIERILGYTYQGRYTNLVLSLLYPDRDWKDAVFHEDHIFPQSEFQVRGLRKRKYNEEKIQVYLAHYNTLCNLELLTESENLSKNATPFDEWFKTRDASFRKRHLIPDLSDYSFDSFDEFSKGRTELIVAALKSLNEAWHSSVETPLDEPPTEVSGDKTKGHQERAERYDLRKKFWQALLVRASGKTSLHANISPGEYHWIGTSSGVRGLNLNYSTRQEDSTVELYIDRGADDINKSIFDFLHGHKVEIEKLFGGDLSWQRLDDKRACRIAHTTTLGGWRSEELRWPEIHDAMIDSMVRLEKAFAPQLARLKSEVLSKGEQP